MLHKTDNSNRNALANRVDKDTVGSNPIDKAELRRQMYERIAQGNQLAALEEMADNKFQGR